jgi:hypothetical protein
MDNRPTFVAHAQTAEVVEPGQAALDHPAMASWVQGWGARL